MARRVSGRGFNLAMALAAAIALAALEPLTGRIDAASGLGWDGQNYVQMFAGPDRGTPNTALRPLIVYANYPAFRLLGNPVTTFRAMNFLYAAGLALMVCLLFDVYSTHAAAKLLLVANLSVTIPLAKYVAYYPALIDLGAVLVVTGAVYLIVTGRRVAAALAVAAAVLAREFAIAVVLFGVIRDLRRRVPIRIVAATYAPAVLVFLGWRALVQGWYDAGTQPLELSSLAENAGLWQDPLFVALFVYFTLTIFGGISLFVFARPVAALRRLRDEPEWLAYAALVVAAAAVGSADMWRYLQFLLPVFVVAFAACAAPAGRRWSLVVASLVCAATVVTQRPFQAIDLSAYFRDWFPYYLVLGRTPLPEPHPALLPLWTWRFAIAGGLLALLSVVSARAWSRRSDAGEPPPGMTPAL